MATKPRKCGRSARLPEYQSYIFRIEEWEPSYSFGLNHSRHFEGPYLEHLHLALKGVFLSPDKAKDRHASLTVIADRQETRAVADPADYDRKPRCVGSLTIRGSYSNFLGSLPYDAMWGLVGLLSCGSIRMLNLGGPALFRGEALIETMSFARDIDPDEW